MPSSLVKRCSHEYRIASIATTTAMVAVGAGRLAYAGGAAAIGATASTLEEAVAARNALKIAFRLGLNQTARIYTPAEILARYGSEEAGIAAAARTNAALNAGGAAAVAGAINSFFNLPDCRDGN